MTDASIIVAAWNAERTILSAIASALLQSDVSVEVVVADDASTDGTAKLVDSVNDSRVRLVRCGANGGPSAARNAAIAAASGAWIAVLDADDTMLPGRIAALLARARAHDLDIVADNMWVQREGRAPQLFINESTDSTLENVTLEKFCLRNFLFGREGGYGYLKPMFRAAFLRRTGVRYDPAMRVGEDFMLVAEALAHGARYGRLRGAWYNYTVAPGSISHQLSLAQANAMLAADDRFLARFGASLPPRARHAMHLHRRSVRDGAAFIAMIDDIKQPAPVSALRQAWRCPAALRHFRMPLQARLNRLRQRAFAMVRQNPPSVAMTPPVRAWDARR
jgi:succinoglycan biosynthesis protein ExoO